MKHLIQQAAVMGISEAIISEKIQRR